MHSQSILLVASTVSQNSGATYVLGTIDQEEQLPYPCANLMVLNFFLKKPCAEWEEAFWSGLIRATRALKPWCIPWFRFLIVEMTSEDVLQPLHDAVPCCVHQYSFALVQWEIAWQLERSGNGASDSLIIQGECFNSILTRRTICTI